MTHPIRLIAFTTGGPTDAALARLRATMGVDSTAEAARQGLALAEYLVRQLAEGGSVRIMLMLSVDKVTQWTADVVLRYGRYHNGWWPRCGFVNKADKHGANHR